MNIRPATQDDVEFLQKMLLGGIESASLVGVYRNCSQDFFAALEGQNERRMVAAM